MPNEVKLLPCPFCGAPPKYESPHPCNWQCASVFCTNPCCVVKPHGCVEKSPEKAIAAWNTRPTTVVTDEVVERVAAAIDEALPESDRLSLAPSQIKRAARAALASVEGNGNARSE